MVDIPNGKNLQNGKEIMGFSPSGPPKGSGPHRYIFLLFSQDSKIGNAEASCVNSRKGFKTILKIKTRRIRYRLGLEFPF